MKTGINRRKFIVGASCSLCGSLILPSCTQVPLTNRSQLNLYDSNLPIVIFQGSMGGIPIPKVYANEKSLNKEIETVYGKFLSKAKEDKILLDNTDESKKIETIGKEIYTSLNKYYINKGEKNPVEGFNWQFALIESETKNAWCMPGGKIAFYTGILPICKNDDGIAAVMGHEIAHAVAKHSVERASRGVVLNVGTRLVDIVSGGKISNVNRVVGMDTVGLIQQIGIMNPFNRKQESEADYLGMIFSSLSGYDIRETVKIWERMKEINKGKEPMEFMSTHPSSKNRISNINGWTNDIILEYPPIKIS